MSHPLVFCLWILCTSFLTLGFWSVVSIVQNVRLARTTGLPFVVLPFSLLGAPWPLAQSIVFWHNGYEPFERLKTETFLAVSPGGLILYTCDPDVNSRLYRKVTGPFFSENTMCRVFVHSVSGAKILLAALVRPGAYRQLRAMSARLCLHTLTRMAFSFQTDVDLTQALAFQDDIPDGKTLSFSQALHGFVDSLVTVFIAPHWLLRLSPFRSHRRAVACYSELGSYMNQLKRTREDEFSEKSVPGYSSHEDLLDLLVQAGTSSQAKESPRLSNAQIIGQIFLFMFAGHEANANILVSIVLLLACHPEVQKALQRDLDSILGDTSPDTWSYDEHYSALMHSTVGAIINETLRLFTVIPVLPKHVPPEGRWLSITVKDQCHPLPPNTIALINTSATHRHPEYWLNKPATKKADKRSSWRDIRSDPRQRPYAVVDFDPSRWLDPGSTDETGAQANSANFLKPRAGTFIPFSEGSRGCLGRRFALVEVCAVVATLFKTHSVELVADTRNGSVGEEEAWLEARQCAALTLSEGTKFGTSLRVVDVVPIRFVPRKPQSSCRVAEEHV
ncbi:cytochrome P450 [Daldinia caldariorum]|uniref:cytochrome P450 n=1 Tax=Daldinia caldariorum TaxID=326644 RepID=UPI002007CE52|nr:cytochrome P450 [Daldinia caldariorum]KAI1465650.1 cytochrome P450 [Daldinia caldariorum]